MKLAFYKVDNSQNYERHTFDGLDEDEIFKMIDKLDNDEFRCYDFERTLDVLDFVKDYNDEILDGGWWCVEIY